MLQPKVIGNTGDSPAIQRPVSWGLMGVCEMEVTGQREGGEQVGDSQWQHFRARSCSKELVAKLVACSLWALG